MPKPSHGSAASEGVRDLALLESAVAAPQAILSGKSPYKDIIELSAAYLFYLCRNHPFIDGNKRTALGACIVFLRLNGIDPQPDSPKWEQLALDIAASTIDRDTTTTRLGRTDFLICSIRMVIFAALRSHPLTLFLGVVSILNMGVRNRSNGIIFSTVIFLFSFAPAFAADPDTDGDGLTDLEETAPGRIRSHHQRSHLARSKSACHFPRAAISATITSTNEWERLVPLLTASGQPNFWLGASDEKLEGDWRWVTGEPFTFNLWNFGEPNNCCGGENFLAITTSFWNDAGSAAIPTAAPPTSSNAA